MNRRDFLKRLGLMPAVFALRLPGVDLPIYIPAVKEPDDNPELSHDHTGPCFDIETKYCLSGDGGLTDEEIEAYITGIMRQER